MNKENNGKFACLYKTSSEERSIASCRNIFVNIYSLFIRFSGRLLTKVYMVLVL